ncbi:MAG: leucyl aminopeptidase [Rhodospirillales bacterium]|nr:leucyl aminopeptidase [Rhodospirillales bacterium]MCB9996136.1 leucyl aminopeptidase [Rhodospirillales bacterium]
MPVTISFTAKAGTAADTAIVAVYSDNRLSPSAEDLDRDNDGVITRALKAGKAFKGKKGQILTLSTPKDSDYQRIMLLGYGDAAKLDRQGCETCGGKLLLALRTAGAEKAHLYINHDSAFEDLSGAAMAAHTAMGLKLRDYSFDKYKSKDDEDDESGNDAPEQCEVITAHEDEAQRLFAPLDAEAAGVFFARDLVNEPPNMLYPESFAKIIRDELKPLGVEIEIFDEKKLQKLGFEAHIAVGMGSARPPYAVVMRWKGDKKAAGIKGPLAFVGKGVTFDTGGVNLKPSGGMEDMKLDMGGAAAVVGLMKTLALRKSSADIIGIVGLAENMPSHMAYRPSDVIGSLSGKTIEVMNTDAEGRLVLADCLTYVQRTFSPSLVIDLATLTGAMMVALGYEYCGTFVNDNDLWTHMEAASKDSGEKLWRMPLDAVFKKDMESKIGDLRSLGGMGRYAGACTAAGFLEHFIEDGRPWAHMDIAGTAWIKSDTATCPKPGTGFGVRVLDRMIALHYE